MDLSEAARALAQQHRRRRYTKICERCGISFVSARPEARFCSVRCGQRAAYLRRKEQRGHKREPAKH